MAELNRIRYQVTLPIGRVSYPNLAKATVSRDYPDNDPEFNVEFIFGKDTMDLDAKYHTPDASVQPLTVQGLDALMKQITEEHKAANGGYIDMSAWRNPFKPGAAKAHTKSAEQYKGKFFISVKNKQPVICLDQFKQPLDPADKREVYGGMYARAVVSFVTYNKGISAYIDVFQKIEDFTPFGNNSALDGMDMLGALPASGATPAPAPATQVAQTTPVAQATPAAPAEKFNLAGML